MSAYNVCNNGKKKLNVTVNAPIHAKTHNLFQLTQLSKKVFQRCKSDVENANKFIQHNSYSLIDKNARKYKLNANFAQNQFLE